MRPRTPRVVAVQLLAASVLATGLYAAASATAPAAASRAQGPLRSGRAAAKASDSVLARVGRERITRREVQRRLNELPEPYRANYGTPDGRQQFLDRLIEERVWLLGARKHGVSARPDVRRQMEQAERDLLIRTYVNELMAANPPPSDSEAHAYYDAHPSDYRIAATVTLSHVLLASERDARRVHQWAKGGQDWRKLAARYSADSVTKGNGGALGTVTREGNFAAIGPQPALAESALALGTRAGPGAIGGPYRTDRGWHVLKVDIVKPETVRPFEQVRGAILRQLGQPRSQEYYRRRLAEEKASLGFTIDSAAVREFVSQKKTAQELFREGQDAGAPTARIAAYRRLLQDYPDSDVSPQAQFMIGFIYSEELKNYEEAEKAFREMLGRYAKSELAESARWMIEHMRNEDAPTFMNLEADSSARTMPTVGTKRSSEKP